MTNLDKLNGIFCEVFSVDASALGAGFDNKSVEGSSYDNARAILAKYEIEL